MADNTTNNLSLEELDSEETQKVNTPIEEGDGNKTPEDVKDKLEEQNQNQEEEEEETEEDELENEEEEESEEDTTSKKGTEDEEEDEESESEEEVSRFFDQLSSEIGFDVNELEIDFEGEDPLTPKGFKKVIDAIKDKEVDAFDNYLKSNYPDAYQHFMALQGGMSSEEYLKSMDGGVELVPSEQQVSDSVDMQKELIKEDLIAKGIKRESIINATLKDLEEDDELLTEALAIRKVKEDARNERFQELEEKAAKKVQEETQLTNSISEELSKISASGLISTGITIPKAERAEAINSFKKNLRIENGKIFHVVEVDPKNIADALGKEYFSKKGSLDKIVETKAKTVNAVKLRAAAQEEGKTKGAKRTRKGGNSLTFGEMED